MNNICENVKKHLITFRKKFREFAKKMWVNYEQNTENFVKFLEILGKNY